MAYLGHTARIAVATTTLAASQTAWEALGFSVQDATSERVRMTDGQILLTLMNDAFSSPAVAYFHADPQRLAVELQGKGLALRETSPDGFACTPFEGLQVFVHQRPMENAERHTGAKNDVLGYLDALSVGVPSVAVARAMAEDLGYFVQEEWGMPQPRSDVTDGLLTIAFHQRAAHPYVAYAVEVTKDLIATLQEVEGVSTQVTEIDGDVSYVRLTTPEGTKVVLLHDDNYE